MDDDIVRTSEFLKLSRDDEEEVFKYVSKLIGKSCDIVGREMKFNSERLYDILMEDFKTVKERKMLLQGIFLGRMIEKFELSCQLVENDVVTFYAVCLVQIKWLWNFVRNCIEEVMRNGEKC